MAKLLSDKKFSAKDFRAELVKAMPGYSWTVKKTTSETRMEATGTQSSGMNRISTLSVIRTEKDDATSYESKSAGYGLRAVWLHRASGKTLLSSLRALQDHYEMVANTHRSHAAALANARPSPSKGV